MQRPRPQSLAYGAPPDLAHYTECERRNTSKSILSQSFAKDAYVKEMHIVAIASQKGGSGKTTLARNLAVAGSECQCVTGLLDTDPQGSLTDWWNRRKAKAPAFIRYEEDIHGLFYLLRRAGNGIVFVDTPPSVHAFVQTVVDLSDLTLVPVRPSPDDLSAVKATLRLLEGRRWAFVLTQVKPRTRLVQEAARVLVDAGKLAPVQIIDRVEYAMSAASGSGVVESEPRGAAAEEIRLLFHYVTRRLQGQNL
ncbi:ParA family protein [Azospirillaceae bacterium]